MMLINLLTGPAKHSRSKFSKKECRTSQSSLESRLEKTRTAVREERATLVKDLYRASKSSNARPEIYGGELGSDIDPKVQTSVFYLVLSLVFLRFYLRSISLYEADKAQDWILSALSRCRVLVVVMAIPIHKRIDVCEP